jgi:glycosyltransferase involved in cell wall biosynthesis
MKKILAYMDFLCPTGFGTVSINIMGRMNSFFKEKNIKVDLVALNFGTRDSFDLSENIRVVNIGKEVTLKGGSDVYFRNHVLQRMLDGNYDLFWAMNDVNVISPILPYLAKINAEKKKKKRKQFKTMLYTPIDSKPQSKFVKNLDLLDKLITYTEYGKEMLISHLKQDIKIIPHGIDLKVYKTLDNKTELREKWGLPIDKTIFGNVNRNNPRKDLGTTLLAFERIKRDCPDLVIYLHCYHSPKDSINILNLCEQLDLEVGKDVYLPMDEDYLLKGRTDTEMNELYNCLDGFVNTTMAEGWGLSQVESMAVNLPSICPMHTSLKEITDYGKMVEYPITELDKHIQVLDGEFVRYKSNTIAVSQAMLSMYWGCHKKNGKLDYLKKYDWDIISRQFENEIENLLEG